MNVVVSFPDARRHFEVQQTRYCRGCCRETGWILVHADVFRGNKQIIQVSRSKGLSRVKNDVRCCSCAVQTLTLPWQSADGISSTNEAYLIHLTPAISTSHVHNGVIRFRNKVRRGTRPVERHSPISRVSRHLECPTHLLFDPMCDVVMARCRWFEEDFGAEVVFWFFAHVQAESSTMLGSTVDTCSCVSPTMDLVFCLKRTWDQMLSYVLLLTFKRNPAPCLVRQWIRVPASVP